MENLFIDMPSEGAVSGGWETCDTGRSSNDGLENWVATARGGFAPMHSVSVAVPAQITSKLQPLKRHSQQNHRDSPGQEQLPASQAEQQLETPPREQQALHALQNLPSRHARAAAGAAHAIASALGLTPGTSDVVSAAAAAGAAAALAVSRSDKDDDARVSIDSTSPAVTKELVEADSGTLSHHEDDEPTVLGDSSRVNITDDQNPPTERLDKKEKRSKKSSKERDEKRKERKEKKDKRKDKGKEVRI